MIPSPSLQEIATPSPWRLCVAPMMDWTDRHCRYFHRLLTKKTLLYTEMVTTGALLHGDIARHLDFDPAEHPLALQLGGSEPAALAACAKLAQRWGYDEVNLNCGCPSERVQRGAFGACLMAEPALVADGIKAMRDAVSLPITVKHRIGIDQSQAYDFVRDFVGTLAHAGCEVFIVHARNAWLKGLSPKANRDVPPLRYDTVYQLKQDFPHLTIVLNGGVGTLAQIDQHLTHVDGVMVGRQAYHDPWFMHTWDERYWGLPATLQTRTEIEQAMIDYMANMQTTGESWQRASRHILGLWNGLPGARRRRQLWSDHTLKTQGPHRVAALIDAALQTH